MSDHLTVADVLAIHEVLIEGFGGAAGLRDAGALEAAIFRPQSGYYHDVIAQAAALMESLAMNHPFVDGNKRVAFGAADVFLRLNGYAFNGDPDEAHHFLIGLFDAGEFRIEKLEPWLRANTEAL
jgi:death-on-curing protein